MKRIFYVVLFGLLAMTTSVQANDYLEKESHYRAYANGQNRIHFKFPVYSRGGYDYYVGTEANESYAYYMLNGSGTKVPIFYYGSEREKNGPSANDDYSYGRAYIKASTVGVVEVTNTTSGQRRVIQAGGSYALLDVKKVKEAENDDDYTTWLEVDWYPYETLATEKFRVGTHVDIRKRYTGNNNYTEDWILAEDLQGANNAIKPQLYDPYFYGVSDEGKAGYGYAAVPYMVFDEPISYTTSLDDAVLKTSDRSGTIFVPTTDTIQENFYATFITWFDKDHHVQRAPQQTTKVNIPAYHRIYHFNTHEELDTTNTFTGNNVLTWEVKNPHLSDLVSGDFFEIQRALKSDFSDAKSLDVVAMRRGEDKGFYTYVDNSRDTWTGNLNSDSTEAQKIDGAPMSSTIDSYIIRDNSGNPLWELNHIKATADQFMLPSLPVYYRIRRASSSVWGWTGHEFVMTDVCQKHNYLAPLALTQPNYTKDAKYDENHEVHFKIDIENEELRMANVGPISFSCPQNDNGRTYRTWLPDEVPVKVVMKQASNYPMTVRFIDPEDHIVYEGTPTVDTLRLTVPKNTIMQLIGYQINTKEHTEKPYFSSERRIEMPGTFILRDEVSPIKEYVFLFMYSKVGEYHKLVVDDIAYRNPLQDPNFLRVQSQLGDSIRTIFENILKSDTYGRAMWDRTAQLVLIKTEDGLSQEFIIPQDSIRRLPDGNWQASYTDIANKGCTNYSYAVRIDQSQCDLCLLDTARLAPVPLFGPNLYFDEGASIAEFTASQGDAKGDHKRSVLLNWQPSSLAVDGYILTRVKEGSDEAADTLYTGIENGFFDLTATPKQRYEYTVTAVYSCNGKESKHSATTIGWRTHYGEIAGQVFMPDNSGMAGVNVALQGPDGQTIRTAVTDADGAYRFDSIEYPLPSGGNYAVIPTHAYGTFSFNYTSAATASITLNPENAIAYGIHFFNTATVRLSGRALYKNSTVPVAGAMFVLNGDTVRRNDAPQTTAIDGTFELTVTKGQPNKLQIFKPGHTFEGEGILRVEGGSETFALDESLDGVRFYDETKVRLIGRVAGGNDQRDLPHGFGLGKNNLGDDLQLVLQLEGDNTAHLVHDPNDLTRDTMVQVVESQKSKDKSQITHTLFEKKRITVRPDATTGEYAVDLYPVKYKVVQATAKGYATLFPAGTGSETFDLTDAPLRDLTETYEGDTVHYQALYDRIYHTPVQIQLTQLLYGIEQDGFGEKEIRVSSFANNAEPVQLYTKGKDGKVTYTMGYPVFMLNRRYQFTAAAFENYYYNNDPEAGALDRVPQRGGQVTIHNGLHSSTDHAIFQLDNTGRNSAIWLPVDRIETEIDGEGALRTVTAALTVEGNTVESDVFQAFVAGDIVRESELQSTDADINLLDIIRDPGGNGSYAWVESGTTYSYSYTENYAWEAGLTLRPKYGLNVSNDVGLVEAPQGVGTYTGSTFESSKTFTIDIPIVHNWSWGYKYNYSYTTSDKVTTSSSHSRDGIGSNADVFLGTTISQLSGKAKSVAVIDDSLYQARRPAIEAGTMKVLASGVDATGKPYHLVVGEKVVLGTEISNTFAYSQHYILNTVLPKIVMEQMNLLMDFPNEDAAQAAADDLGEPVYWYLDSTKISLRESVGKKYRMILPSNSTKAYVDQIAALNKMFGRWSSLLINNEKEKIMARMVGKGVGTYSVSYGNTYTHTDTYSAMANYNEMPQGGGLVAAEAEEAAARLGEQILKQGREIAKFFDSKDAARFGTLVADAVGSILTDQTEDGRRVADLGTVTNTSKWSISIVPTLSYSTDDRTTEEVTRKKTTGFTLVPDAQGDITVSVYRAPADSLWKDLTSSILDNVNHGTDDALLYGSYVFFTEAGSTYCVHEQAEQTKYYSAGMPLGHATMALAVPELSVDVHEQTGVPAEQRAVFRVELRNAGQVQVGAPSSGKFFSLALDPESNPNGAKVYLSGAPLINPVSFLIEPGQTISQIIEVERGLVDDYDSLRLFFYLDDCLKYNNTSLDLGVHFMPVSSDVTITAPKQNWIMNTLSAKDSTGYYLPIEISGFNIWHKNFDHIEFQYKLATESEDMWVNQCSFYANDSLYNLASGNKAMIENGRIMPFRFYGERDPMEQQYDLRAVSFCRYGSGFVTKSSPVISGTKDTRPPRVFGAAQPADAILGVGNDLKLRFNEPIAGNYLDEDNNFQIIGMTNATGITTGTSLHFADAIDSKAVTQVERSLTDKSFSIDMLVRPANAQTLGSLFFTSMPNSDYAVQLACGDGGRLALFLTNEVNVYMFLTERNVLPTGVFSRVVAVYDNDKKTVQLYLGTQRLAFAKDGFDVLPSDFVLRGSAPLVFGSEWEGDMLEARLWSKALTQEEIAATHMKYLTGYERDLMAYYRMDEGRGNELADKANGATLYCSGTTWNHNKGISVALKANEQLQLDGNLLSRSSVYDESIMLWFKTAGQNGSIFRAGRIDENRGTLLAMENSRLMLHSDSTQWIIGDDYANGEWHHVVLTVNRTMNNAAVYVDGEMKQSFSASMLGGISGAMYLGGNGFTGNIDDLVFFEQALPKYMVEGFDNLSPTGDEMGIFGYLPFEEQILNPNGVLELVFSPNDQRVFKDPYGNVVDKVVPLVLKANSQKPIADFADKTNYAPTRNHGLLTKMNFDWSFNGDELLINLNMEDREINKQTIYVTVRDVEDLNGNPMASPVSWVAFVDRNALKWSERTLRVISDYENVDDFTYFVDIINTSGRRHQYTIESLPDWLTVSEPSGSMNALEEKQIRLNFAANLPVGVYNDQIYLTDEDGLAEPLIVEYTVEANQPYSEVDRNKYMLNMSICGQVQLVKNNETVYDTDPNDIVYAMYKDECVGMAHISLDAANKSQLFLTVYGSDKMNRKPLRFQLWQASTGKVYDLTPNRNILFAHGFVYGCGDGKPVIFSTNGNERQTINLQPGWNWTSFNLIPAMHGAIDSCMNANEAWTEGDEIKNPEYRRFCSFDTASNTFVGALNTFHYSQMYMINSSNGNTMHISGMNLPTDSMKIRVRGDGQWSVMPCLLKQVTPIAEALSDYLDKATPGDLIKSHDHFAYFSENGKWEGDLTAMRPGEGYLFRRMGAKSTEIRFFNRVQNNAPKRVTGYGLPVTGEEFSNPKASTNMTMIAVVKDLMDLTDLKVYVNDELAAVAEPIDSLYFLTIQSGRVGELRFEMDGETLIPVGMPGSRDSGIPYFANAHYGTIKAPVLLSPVTGNLSPVTAPYKLIEDDHVVIIRNNEKYDVTGKKL